MKTLVFDLDQTLYTNYGIYDEFNRRVVRRASYDLSEDPDLVSKAINEYWHSGRTVYDYIRDHKLKLEEVVADMFDVDRNKYMSTDVKLRMILTQIEIPKYILTDGVRRHAEESLKILGVDDLFLGSLCFDDTGYRTKKERLVYESFFNKFNLKPTDCIFVEDSIPNLEIGKQLGMTTVNVKGHNAKFIDYSLKSIYDLPSIIDLV